MITTDGTKFDYGFFKIATNEGPKAMAGHFHGLLGYHADLRAGHVRYDVTHLITGHKLFDFKHARDARKFITEAAKLDWDFDSLERGKAMMMPCLMIALRLGLLAEARQSDERL